MVHVLEYPPKRNSTSPPFPILCGSFKVCIFHRKHNRDYNNRLYTLGYSVNMPHFHIIYKYGEKSHVEPVLGSDAAKSYVLSKMLIKRWRF